MVALAFGAGLAALAPSMARADTASPTVSSFGTLGGTESQGLGVNDSGEVVGQGYLSGNSAYRAILWTQAGGLINLGYLGGNDDSYARAISADGNAVVGLSSISPSGNVAFLWTQADGMVSLGTLGGTASIARAVSADGSVVVGDSTITGGDDLAFLWTQAGGMVSLGTLGGSNSSARGISADGSVVVGDAQNTGNSAYLAFLWTQAGGMTSLGTLGGTNSYAFGVSGDGSTVVGEAQNTGNSAYLAFRWTQAGGMTSLGTLGGTNSEAFAGSSNGSVVVGEAQITGNSAYHAFYWTQADGTQDLNTLLSSAGVNMTGITLNEAYAISPNGRFITGDGTFPGSSEEAFLVCYDPSNGCVGVTTGADQAASVQNLAADQRATAIESRATASELLGTTRPVDGGAYAYAGAMYGSAVAYTGGQYAARGVTVLGGIAYGAQDYPNIQQGDAPTLAVAARYTFDDPFGDKGNGLHPYGEIGGWITPQADLTLSRAYANGAGMNLGQGETDTTSWAEYGRGGLAWNATKDDQFTGYGELGQQYMSFAPYTENSDGNPFPASVGGGLFRMGVSRIGGSYTRDLSSLIYAPISFTLAGAAAQSFDVHSGLTVNVPLVGITEAGNEADTWGEFGARIETRFTDQLALDLDLNGTTGGGALGTVLHGGVGAVYKF